MRLLLDTHAWLWWLTDDAQLPVRARDLLADEAHEIWVSAASAWEIATKERLGKLPQVAGLSARFPELVAADGFRHLGIDHRHALMAGALPSPHRDPFDRMLAAQARIEGLVVLSRDPALAALGAEVVW